jgi:type IV secretory pathway TrbD component
MTRRTRIFLEGLAAITVICGILAFNSVSGAIGLWTVTATLMVLLRTILELISDDYRY